MVFNRYAGSRLPIRALPVQGIYCLILILYVSPANWLRGRLRVNDFPPVRPGSFSRLHLLKEEVPVFPGCQWLLFFGDLWA
jgi:hypothetical protein